MSALVGVYDLLNRHTKKFDAAELHCPIADRHIDDYEKHWLPAIDGKLAEIGTDRKTLLSGAIPPAERTRIADALRAANLQDFHWRWPEKVKARAKDLEWQSFAVLCGGLAQGLMFASLLKRCRDRSQAGQHMVYVDLVSTAPWNRNGFTKTPLYKGVGRLMVVTAISLSVKEGFDGRIGLHSLPQSLAWYRDVCKMTDLGPDIHYGNLVYFEMTSAQAKAFIK